MVGQGRQEVGQDENNQTRSRQQDQSNQGDQSEASKRGIRRGAGGKQLIRDGWKAKAITGRQMKQGNRGGAGWVA